MLQWTLCDQQAAHRGCITCWQSVLFCSTG